MAGHTSEVGIKRIGYLKQIFSVKTMYIFHNMKYFDKFMITIDNWNLQVPNALFSLNKDIIIYRSIRQRIR